MDATDFLKGYSREADGFLKGYFSAKKKSGKKIDRLVSESLSIFENSLAGGKRLRGALTVLGYQLTQGKINPSIIPVSCGVEILHNFLLIHDDIIDKDELRRGRPTVHKIYSRGKGEHYGISKAIIIGDIGAFLGYELIVTSDFPQKRISLGLSKLNDLLLKTMYGEMLDIDFDFKKAISWNDILKVRTYKTAYYTLVMPLTLGATLGGANESTLKAIEGFGKPVGIAFQLSDDILGVFGQAQKTGKSNESDIRGGKKTFLFAKALELTKGKDREFLLSRYGADDLTPKQITKIRDIIESCGSREYSFRVAKRLVNQGKSFIPKMTHKKELQVLLGELADYIVSRER